MHQDLMQLKLHLVTHWRRGHDKTQCGKCKRLLRKRVHEVVNVSDSDEPGNQQPADDQVVVNQSAYSALMADLDENDHVSSPDTTVNQDNQIVSLCNQTTDCIEIDIDISSPDESPGNMTAPALLSSDTGSVDMDVAKWLTENKLHQHQETFKHFTMSDLILLSRSDLIQLCGLADGIRMHNRINCQRVIHVSFPGADAASAVHLYHLTSNELKEKVTDLLKEFLQKDRLVISNLYVTRPDGMDVKISDEVVRNIANESSFVAHYKPGMYCLFIVEIILIDLLTFIIQVVTSTKYHSKTTALFTEVTGITSSTFGSFTSLSSTTDKSIKTDIHSWHINLSF
jgi:hypothetical protein